MNKSKHTPGPWHRNIKPASKYNTIFAGRNTHITHLATQGLSEEEIEGNCKLIIAAPDLLEACKMMVDDYDSNEDSESITYAKLAISKAEFKF